MTSCDEVRRLAGRFLALELTGEEETGVREHLARCQACRDWIVNEEPSQAIVWSLGAADAAEDDHFVGEVMAGIHQRRLETGLGRRQRYLALAAGLLIALLGGTVALRRVAGPNPATLAQATPAPTALAARQPVHRAPSFVEVDKAGVRLYQLTPASDERNAVQMAFIVDPHVEL
ncbi:MAG TPA: zf-HC2 domain-containing protein [Thermoanaerobaculaceae bacterium]|nr:zf-HC2 domain-containing protein [Thermoanaerobaculaceae bacterium]